MKQVFQDLRSGDTMLVEAPAPAAARGTVVVATSVSLVSAGTERMLVEFGRATYLDKARQQPEKVRQVFDKARTDGVLATMAAVQSKLDQPLPLGYSNVGVVTEVGPGVTQFRVGDRVVSNGPHADVVRVSANLCAPVPDGVDDESAAFTVVASIGLQGVRLAQPALGETIVVTGAGLIGLLTVQILIAHGCKVLAIDMDPARLELARRFGAEVCNAAHDDPVAAATRFSRGVGVDGVIITASTSSSEPVAQAARMCRKRGRIVLVGTAGLELNRSDFYAKELTFQVSCSYGAGRYDPEYEDGGHDYPLGYVRWTVKRNFEAVLDLLASRKLEVEPLVTQRFALERAPDAYRALLTDKDALGILLQYPGERRQRSTRRMTLAARPPTAAGRPVVGFIGAGNHASRALIPAFKAAGAELHTIATSGGASASIQGGKAGFASAASEVEAVLGSGEIDSVVIATRHDSHAALVVAALDAGKHVYVEKPLALRDEELQAIESALLRAGGRVLTVGFNRRFAPHVVRMKTLLQDMSGPKSIMITVNAGPLPLGHWLLDAETGGGRILGEGCHFIDLLRHLAGSPIDSIAAERLASVNAAAGPADSALVTLRFSDGSVGTLHYLSNGSSSFPKERIELFSSGRVMQLDNFRTLRGFGWPALRRMGLWRQDKGQHSCVAAFVDAVQHGRAPPIPVDEILEVSRASIEAARLLR